MNKQVLFSLLGAAAIAPFGANANFDYAVGEAFENGGITLSPGSGLNLFGGETADALDATAGALTCKIVDLPKGNYILTAADLTNATISVSGPVANQVFDPVAKTLTFTVTAMNSTVIVNVAAKEAYTPFVAGDFNLEVVFGSFSAIKTALEGAIIPFEPITAVSQKATLLQSDEDFLQLDINDYKNLLNALTDGATTDLEKYTNSALGLYNDPYTVKAELDDLNARIEALNDEIKAENARYAQEVANASAVAGLTADLTGPGKFEEQVNGYVAAIQALPASQQTYVQNQCQGIISTDLAAIQALKNRITALKNKYPNGNGNLTADPEYAAIQADIAALDILPLQDAYNAAVANAQAWDVMSTYPAQLEALYDKIAEEFMAVKDYPSAMFNGVMETYQEGTNVKGQLDYLYAQGEESIHDYIYNTITGGEDNAAVNSVDAATAFANAKADLENLESTVLANVAAVEALYTEWTTKVAEMNALLDAVENLSDQFDGTKINIVPLQDKAADIRADIDQVEAMTENANKKYKTFLFPDTTPDYDDIKTEISNLEAQYTALITGDLAQYKANVAQMLKWETDLQAAVDEIIENSPNGFKDIVAKFGYVNGTPVEGSAYAGALQAIQQGIAAMKNANGVMIVDPGTAVINGVTDAIDHFQTAGVAAALEVTDAVALYTTAQAAIPAPSPALKVLPSGSESFNSDQFIQDAADYLTGLHEVVNSSAANDIEANVNAYYTTGGAGYYINTMPADIATAVSAWYKDTVENNNDLLQDKYNYYASLIDVAENPNAPVQYGPEWTKLNTELTKLKVLVDWCATQIALPPANDAAYKALNQTTTITASQGNIVGVYAKMVQTFEPAIDNAAQNVQNYLNVSNQAAIIESLLADLVDWTNANSTAPATQGWLDVEIPDLKAEVKNQLKPVLDSVKAEYDNNDLSEDEANAAIATIQSLKTPIDAYKAEVKANEEAHAAQVLESKAAWNDRNNAITALTNSTYEDGIDVTVTYTNSNGEEVTLGTDDKTGWINYINGLNAKLVELDNKVYDNFKAHTSVDYDPDYADIQAQIAAIQQTFISDYQQAVIDANNELVKNLFGDTFFWLNLGYKNAVETYEQLADNHTTDLLYNDYVTALLRKAKAKMTSQEINDITAMLGGDFANEVHLAVYATDAQIEDIRTAIDDILNKANYQDIDVLTAADFAGVQSDIEDLLNYYKKYTTDITKYANDFAEKYYWAVYAEAEAMVNDAIDALTAAGIPGYNVNAGLAVPIAALNKAEALFNAARNGDHDTLSLQMGQVLAELAKVGPSDSDTSDNLNLQNIVNNYWNTQYNNAVATVEDIIDQMNEVIGVDKASALDAANAALTAIKALNNGVTLANVQDKVNALNGYVADAQAALTDLQNAEKANQDNIIAQGKLLNQVSDLYAIYDEVMPQIARLDLTPEQFAALNVEGIYDMIDGLDSDIRNATTCASQKTYWEYQITMVQWYIYGALVANISLDPGEINGAIAYDKENIISQVPDLKIQYNKLKAEMINKNGTLTTEDEAQLKEWSSMITSLENNYADLPALDYMDMLTSATAIVDALVDLEAELNTVREALGLEPINNSDVADALGILNDKAATVEAAIQQGLDALSAYMDSVKAEYEPKYNGLEGYTAQLNNLKFDYEYENNALLKLGYYETELGSLLTAVQATNAEAAAAQATAAAEANKVQANNDAYTALTAQLDALEDALEAAQTFVKQYGDIAQETQYVDEAAGIQNEIDNARALLEQKHNAVELNAVSDLATINAQDIATNIEGYKAVVAYQYVKSLYGVMQDTVADACDAVKGDHANQTDLDAQLNDIKNAVVPLNQAVNQLYYAMADEDYYPSVDALVVVIKQLTADAAALIDACVDNAVTKGDLDGNGDVTVADYMDLLKLILSGADYDSTDKEHVAGDLNKNGRLDSADLVALINIIRGTSETPARVLAAMRTPGANKVSLEWVAQQDNVRRLAIVLDNTADFTHLMFDIQLPAGMNIVNEGLAERAAGLNFFSNDLGNGIHRILIASSELNTIEGSNGAVVYLDIEGSDSGNIVVEKAEGSDTRGALYSVDNSDANTSGINTLGDYLKSGVDKIYDLGGRMMNKVQQGINIIRNADGTTTKTLKKH